MIEKAMNRWQASRYIDMMVTTHDIDKTKWPMTR